MNKLLLPLLFSVLSFQTFANANQQNGTIAGLKEEFKIPLEFYLKEASRSAGFFFSVDSRNCAPRDKVNNLIKTKIAIDALPNSSIHKHLGKIADRIGNDYNIEINLPLQTIEISCANPVSKGIINNEK